MAERPTGRPGAPRDSAPAAVYVVFGPALKKLWKQKFKLVMALPTSRYGSKVWEIWADFFEITQQNLGGSKTKLRPGPRLRLAEAPTPLTHSA